MMPGSLLDTAIKPDCLSFNSRMTANGRVARDGEDLAVCSNGGEWLTAWHAPDSVPHGTPHGANGSVSLVTIKSC